VISEQNLRTVLTLFVHSIVSVPSLSVLFPSYFIENPEFQFSHHQPKIMAMWYVIKHGMAWHGIKSSASIQPLEASMFIAVWLPYQVKSRKGTQKY
jgi:hypothetical protein